MDGKRTAIVGGTLATDYGVFSADLVLEDERIAGIVAPDGSAAAKADEVIDASGLLRAARRDRPARPLRGSGAHRARGLHHRHDGGGRRRHHDRDRAPADLSARHDRGALPREARHGEAQGRDRLRPLGRAHRAVAARDRASSGRRARSASRPSCRSRIPPTRTSPTPSSSRACARWRPSAGSCWCTPRTTPCCRPTCARLRAEGRRDPLAHHESRPPFVEEEAVHRALFLRRPRGRADPDRARLEPASAPSSCGERERAGQPATMEICPHHLLLDLDDLVRLGPYGVCAPALRERALVERLWDYVADGAADCLVSDHSAYAREEKDAGLRGHLRCAARLPGDPGDGAARARRGLPPARPAARRLRALLLDQRGAHQPARTRARARSCPAPTPTSPSTTSTRDWTVDAASQQFSKNPWSPFDGRRSRARSCGRSCAARRCTSTARSSSSRATAASSPAGPMRATTDTGFRGGRS